MLAPARQRRTNVLCLFTDGADEVTKWDARASAFVCYGEGQDGWGQGRRSGTSADKHGVSSITSDGEGGTVVVSLLVPHRAFPDPGYWT